jgi:FixJ family two-component response regulator
LENAPGTVAVVDDDPSMLRSVERLLNANGFLTEGYSSAEAFLSQGQTSVIRCIVLDIQLGGMSGIDLWHYLRRADINLPVIFITALEDEALERAAVDSGCVAYLRKPFSAELLVRAVNSALRRSSLE